MTLISVIIPVKNGEATIQNCLTSIFKQTVAQKLEVIILDSASTDNTLHFVKKFPVQVFHINPNEFDHGLTRNYGVSLAKGEFVYFTVQDAALADEFVLERMLIHFADKKISAIVGMQATPANSDNDPSIWFKRVSVPKIEVRYFPDGGFNKLSSQQKYLLSNWDNVNAMYRKQSLINVPFRETSYSEDWFWAFDALSVGMKLIRDPSCVSFHYHHQYFSYTFKVALILNYNHYLFFDVIPKYPNFLKALLFALYRTYKADNIGFTDKFYWSYYNLRKSIASFLSVLCFRLAFSIGNTKGIEKLYKLIIKKVPQGKIKP